MTWAGLALLASLTAFHNQTVWTSERALWANAVRWAPNHPRPWINLGREAYLAGDLATAEQAWTEAARVSQLAGRSAYEQAYGRAAADVNLVVLDLDAGRDGRALVRLDRVLEAQPNIPTALQLRARIRCVSGDRDGALTDWNKYRVFGLAGAEVPLPC